MWTARRIRVLGGMQLLCCVAFSGCAEHPPATIEDRSSAAETSAPEIRRATQISMKDRGELSAGPDYEVQPGDTLYAIAFRLGMDYRDLATLNQIEAPYVIFVGQMLATSAPETVARSATDSAAGERSKEAASDPVTQANTRSVIAKTPEPPRENPASSSLASSGSTPAPPAVTASAVDKPSASVTSTPPQPSPQPKATPKPAPLANVPVDRWGWPVKGRVIRSFAQDVHKGIDLAGARGDPVRASAAGVVVYAGTGLSGYGALIIVKHNDTYLSAYGHNDELLAAEGERVSAGKLIARMGSSGTDAVKLHFEIRRNGRPINPTTLLTPR